MRTDPSRGFGHAHEADDEEALPQAPAREARAAPRADALQLLTGPPPRPKRHDRVVFTRAGESAVLLDPSSGNYFSLSDVGARIWELCDGGSTVDEIVRVIADEYDAPLETITGDARELLDELASEGLLEGG